MAKIIWQKIGTEWTGYEEGRELSSFVRRTSAHETATHDPSRPYCVAFTASGEPTGLDGRYACFRTLRAAKAEAVRVAASVRQ